MQIVCKMAWSQILHLFAYFLRCKVMVSPIVITLELKREQSGRATKGCPILTNRLQWNIIHSNGIPLVKAISLLGL